MVPPSIMRAFPLAIRVRRFRDTPSLASEEEVISGRQSLFPVAACTFARTADQSSPATCGTDSPARLQQGWPMSGSPPTRVGYDYSAQPSLAEAGLAPPSTSKTEGCTQKFAFAPLRALSAARVRVFAFDLQFTLYRSTRRATGLTWPFGLLPGLDRNSKCGRHHRRQRSIPSGVEMNHMLDRPRILHSELSCHPPCEPTCLAARVRLPKGRVEIR